MIEIQGAEGETFTFNVTTNAQGVVLFYMIIQTNH